MPKISESKKQKLLAPVRMAIHGWAFANRAALKSRIESADHEIEMLPYELREEARELVKPLRKAFSPKTYLGDD